MYIGKYRLDAAVPCSVLFTARKRSLGQGNVFTPVCQSFCSQGVSDPLNAGIHTPLGTLTWADTP